MKYATRLKIYHVITNTLSLSLVITAIAVDGVGISFMATCLVGSGHWFNFVLASPLVVQFPFAICMTVYAIVLAGDIRRYIWRYAIHVLLVIS
jgi:hypothetical protein